ITVTTSSVSSLRREGGILKQVQVNGGMQPGNSGGPVTDTRGKVVGVSVAGITGTTINFAIPSDFNSTVVDRAKSNPIDPTKWDPGPIVKKDPMDDPSVGIPDDPVRPAGGRTLQQDLAALKGTWESGEVKDDEAAGLGTIKLHLGPGAGLNG